MFKYNIKIDFVPGQDSTGLSYIFMSCKSYQNLGGGFGNLGKYGIEQKCPKNIVGFQLLMCNQHIGAANMRMFCTRNETDYKMAFKWDETTYIKAAPCNWGPLRYCPDNFAVCGFQYEYEPDQGRGNDAAITNVKLMCCRLSTVLRRGMF